jgi:hypothetical protein
MAPVMSKKALRLNKKRKKKKMTVLKSALKISASNSMKKISKG